MAVQVELWKNDITEFLAKDNEFYNYCVNADEYVLQGTVVHIPQSGGSAGVEKNRSVLPGVIAKRSDTDVTYTLDEFTTDPVLIPNADVAELSYDKRQSVIRENMASLREVAMDNLLYNWAKNVPTDSKIATTGGNHTATGNGASGNRKSLAEADFRKAALLLNRQNAPKEGRYMVITADQMNQLQGVDDLRYAFQQVVNLETGVVARLFGFNLLVRSTVVQLDNSQNVKAPEAAGATSDDVAALFYQRDMVERALGTINMYESVGDPAYYGDIYSFLVRMGGRQRRQDGKGVGLLYNVAA